MSNIKVAFITAIYGKYEASTKPFIEQSISCDFICFTNISDIYNNGWIIDTEPYHLTHKSECDNDTYVNSISKNKHTFNIAKYYKQNFYNIPRLEQYDYIFWLDGTIEIHHSNTAEYCISLIQSGYPIITMDHIIRKGRLELEVADSHFNRYTSNFWFGQSQPYQDIDSQYKSYIEKGYTDSYWTDISKGGVWVTCFIAFDMTNTETRRFLDVWYEQTLQYTTQDQIGFPYACQLMKIHPYTLPDRQTDIRPHQPQHKDIEPCNINLFYRKHRHGK